MKPNEAAIDLERLGEQSLGGEIIRVNPQRAGMERIALEDFTDELQLEIELALFSKPPGGGFRRLTLKGGIARTFMGCGHIGRRSLPGLGSTETLAVPTQNSGADSMGKNSRKGVHPTSETWSNPVHGQANA